MGANEDLLRGAKSSAMAVKRALGKGADVNVPDQKGRTAFMIACQEGKKDIVKALLEWNEKADKIDLNVQDKQGYTALMLAVKYNRINVLELLLKDRKYNDQIKKIDLTLTTSKGKNVLMLAAENEEKGCLEWILDNRTLFEKIKKDKMNTLNAKKTGSQKTALWYAARGNNSECVKLLLEKFGDDVQYQEEAFENTLENSCVEAAKVLKERCDKITANWILDKRDLHRYLTKEMMESLFPETVNPLKVINEGKDEALIALLKICGKDYSDDINQYMAVMDMTPDNKGKILVAELEKPVPDIDRVKMVLGHGSMVLNEGALAAVVEDDSKNAVLEVLMEYLDKESPDRKKSILEGVCKNKNNVLCCALLAGQTKNVKTLLNHGANPQVEVVESNGSKYSLIVYAILHKFKDIAEWTVQKCPKVITMDDVCKAADNKELFQQLLVFNGREKPSNFDAKRAYGILKNALRNKNLDVREMKQIWKWLKGETIDINERDADGNTILMLAVSDLKYYELAECILDDDSKKQEVQYNYQNRAGKTALMIALDNNDDGQYLTLRIVDLLLLRGYFLDYASPFPLKKMLDYIKNNKLSDRIRDLITKMISPSVKRNKDLIEETEKMTLAEAHKAILDELKEGVYPDGERIRACLGVGVPITADILVKAAQNSGGINAMKIFLAELDNRGKIKEVIDKIPDGGKNNALRTAKLRGNKEMIKLLLNYGANPKVDLVEEMTPTKARTVILDELKEGVCPDRERIRACLGVGVPITADILVKAAQNSEGINAMKIFLAELDNQGKIKEVIDKIPDGGKNNALCVATLRRDREMIKLLLNYGANPEVDLVVEENGVELSLLVFACMHRNSLGGVPELIVKYAPYAVKGVLMKKEVVKTFNLAESIKDGVLNKLIDLNKGNPPFSIKKQGQPSNQMTLSVLFVEAMQHEQISTNTLMKMLRWLESDGICSYKDSDDNTIFMLAVSDPKRYPVAKAIIAMRLPDEYYVLKNKKSDTALTIALRNKNCDGVFDIVSYLLEKHRYGYLAENSEEIESCAAMNGDPGILELVGAYLETANKFEQMDSDSQPPPTEKEIKAREREAAKREEDFENYEKNVLVPLIQEKNVKMFRDKLYIHRARIRSSFGVHKSYTMVPQAIVDTKDLGIFQTYCRACIDWGYGYLSDALPVIVQFGSLETMKEVLNKMINTGRDWRRSYCAYIISSLRIALNKRVKNLDEIIDALGNCYVKLGGTVDEFNKPIDEHNAKIGEK